LEQVEVRENLVGQLIVAKVGSKAQEQVGFEGIEAELLQVVGLDLVEETNPATLLAQVDHRPLVGRGGEDVSDGFRELFPAITSLGADRLARETFAMDPHNRHLVKIGEVTLSQRVIIIILARRGANWSVGGLNVSVTSSS